MARTSFPRADRFLIFTSGRQAESVLADRPEPGRKRASQRRCDDRIAITMDCPSIAATSRPDTSGAFLGRLKLAEVVGARARSRIRSSSSNKFCDVARYASISRCCGCFQSQSSKRLTRPRSGAAMTLKGAESCLHLNYTTDPPGRIGQGPIRADIVAYSQRATMRWYSPLALARCSHWSMYSLVTTSPRGSM